MKGSAWIVGVQQCWTPAWRGAVRLSMRKRQILDTLEIVRTWDAAVLRPYEEACLHLRGESK